MLGNIKMKIIKRRKRGSVNFSKKDWKSGLIKNTESMKKELKYLKNATINL